MSFYTSLSGLNAAQADMSSISHNLANVSTNGFKKSRTDFADVISSSVNLDPTKMFGSGTVVKSNKQQFSEGSLLQTTSSLDVAISGDGFFAIKPLADGTTVNYTRNGNFGVNQNGFITDSSGNFLQAYPVDGSGTVVAAGLDQTINVQVPQTSGDPVPTAAVGLSVTLPGSAAVPANTFDRFDPDSYNYATQTTVYDVDGNPQTMSTYFRRETTGTPSTWSAYSFIGDAALTSGGSGAVTLTFDGAGTLTTPTGATTFDPAQATGSSTAQTIALNFGTATKQAAAAFTVDSRSQDGKAVGQFQSVAINSDGLITASFSNGDTKALGKIALANFNNPQGLRQLGDSIWSSTAVSGTPTIGEPGTGSFGNLLTSTIERSNVDTTEELVNLIAAQRNFQANAKALDTQNQISQTIFNLR